MNPLGQYATLAKWLAIGALLVGVWFNGHGSGVRAGKVAVADCKAAHAAYIAEVQQAKAVASELARKQEQQWSEDLAMISAKFEDDKVRVSRETKDSVLADIRDGRLRVRYPGCPRVPTAIEAAAGPGVDHGSADRGAADAGDLVGAYESRVAEQITVSRMSDLRLAECQAAMQAERKQ